MDDRFLRDRALQLADKMLPQDATTEQRLAEADKLLAWLKADDKALTISADGRAQRSQVHESHTQKA